MARIVARSYGPAGPEAALAELDAIPAAGGAARRQRLAVHADLLRRAGRPDEARAAYFQAATLERNAAVRDFLTGRADGILD